MDQLEYVIRELLAELAGIPFASVGDDDTLSGELDLDSLELVNLAQDLEEKFNIALPHSAVRSGMTVAELVQSVRGVVEQPEVAEQ